MTDAILLAGEAEQLGLDDDPTLDRILDYKLRQAANRELYLQHVRRAVSIDEEEEREAFQRSKTKLYVQHFKTPSYAEAQQLASGTRTVPHVPVHPWIKTIELPEYGQVDLISWNDIDATLEDIIFELSPGQYSEPQFFANNYHIYRLVESETEVIHRENDFQANRESLRGVIRQRKESLASAAFVQKVMATEELIIRAEALNRLTRYLWHNRPNTLSRETQFIANDQIDNITDYNQEIRGLPIADFRSGRLLVSDILFTYKLNPQKIGYASESVLRENLKNIIGNYARDLVLSELALVEGLHQRPQVVEEIRAQREKLLADRLRKNLYLNLLSTGVDSTQLTFDYLALSNELIDKLRMKTEIEIYLDNLMAVKTTDEGLSRKIDFIAIRTQ